MQPFSVAFKAHFGETSACQSAVYVSPVAFLKAEKSRPDSPEALRLEILALQERLAALEKQQQ